MRYQTQKFWPVVEADEVDIGPDGLVRYLDDIHVDPEKVYIVVEERTDKMRLKP